MVRYATPDMVAAAWIASLPGMTTDMVGAQLPENSASWAASGYVTVTVVGGSPNKYIPLSAPVFKVDCWTCNPDTGLPPWGKAKNLAETVRQGIYLDTEDWLTLPHCDQSARVVSAYFTHEPRATYGDTGDYACMTVDLSLHWVVV